MPKAAFDELWLIWSNGRNGALFHGAGFAFDFQEACCEQFGDDHLFKKDAMTYNGDKLVPCPRKGYR